MHIPYSRFTRLISALIGSPACYFEKSDFSTLPSDTWFSGETSLPYQTRLIPLIFFGSSSDAAYAIIQRKGATYYAVAAGIMRLTEAILRNQNTVLSVSSLVQDFYGIRSVCLSLPTVVNCYGVAEVLRIQLDASEIDQLRRSAEVLAHAIASLKLRG